MIEKGDCLLLRLYHEAIDRLITFFLLRRSNIRTYSLVTMHSYGETRRQPVHLNKEEGDFVSELLTIEFDHSDQKTYKESEAKARELGVSMASARALQQYIVLVCVIEKRRRRNIPFAKEFQRAKQIQRCLEPAARKLLCDALRFAI